MRDTVKVLISDDNSRAMTYASEFKRAGMYSVVKGGGGSALITYVTQEHPNIILLFADLDSLWAVRSIRKMDRYAPLIIVISDGISPQACEEFSSAGADRCMENPQPDELVMSVLSMMLTDGMYERAWSNDAIKTENIATEFIRRAGIPANIKGYRYLRAAIIYAVEDDAMLNRITTRLYPAVAKMFNTTPSCVERAIRNAITIAWERTDPYELIRLFDNVYPVNSYRPTNSAFIAFAADKIRLAQKNKKCPW